MPMPPSSPHLWLILNQKAAASEELRIAVETLRGKGTEIKVRVVWEGADIVRYTEDAVNAKAERIVAAGGDGTLNAVVSTLLKVGAAARPALAILPSGTANDFARACQIPLNDPVRALELAAEAEARPVDVGTVNDNFFLNMATCGFAAKVTAETPKTLKDFLGGAAYTVMGILDLANIPSYRVSLHFQKNSDTPRAMQPSSKRIEKEDVVLIAVGNGRLAGGGHSLVPESYINDGQLDVLLIRAYEPSDLGNVINEVLNPVAGDREFVSYYRVPRFEVRLNAPMPYNLDGEHFKAESFQFGVQSEQIRLVLPDDAPVLKKG
ncbi:lipid kinase YegS [Acanthopleuribacter pedis]|uniref:Lipid kinase YegS n=1 Tax=Acanthopleuribacter pedis TaxID=442870 RepID=A0A8J7Q8A6_9BACT|nr:lipid kinase YegS [Acanthopleuribacter pedis]MBO1318724.1 lipid kinase YegS [Acanthopleuribacter pedis]